MPPRLLSPSWGTTLVNAPKVHVTTHASIASSSRCSTLGTAASSARVGAGTPHRFSSKAYTLPYTHINLAGPNHYGNRSFHSTSPSRADAKDPYQVLGVPRNATASEIKKRYYELARKHHPDTNKESKDSKDRFVEIQAAWDILGNEKKRKEYDTYGAASQQPGFDANAFSRGGFGGFGGFGFGAPFGRSSGGAEEQLFETLFGGAAGRARSAGPPRGDDLEASISIPFVDACKGTTRTVNVTPIVDCRTCEGSGLKAGATRQTCRTCHGSGTQTFVINSGFQMASTCSTCQGTGSTVPPGAHCRSCDGMGKVKERKTVTVDVPSGVEDGMIIRVPRAGDMPISARGTPGDLLVRVNVSPSKVFRRQGTNLYHDAKIPLTTALLGGKVRVPTLDGEVDVRVPSGTQPGQEAMLKGRGVPHMYSRNIGDLYVTFGVQLPRSLTARQRAILQELADDLEGKTLASSGTPPTAVADTPKETSSGEPESEAGPAENETEDATKKETNGGLRIDQKRKRAASG